MTKSRWREFHNSRPVSAKVGGGAKGFGFDGSTIVSVGGAVGFFATEISPNGFYPILVYLERLRAGETRRNHFFGPPGGPRKRARKRVPRTWATKNKRKRLLLLALQLVRRETGKE